MPFEEMIDEALNQTGIEADWQGGGIGDDECDYHFRVSDLKRALDVVLSTLRTANAPPNTIVVAGDVRCGEEDNLGEYEERTRYRLGDLA
jgi:hypothetical protein